MYIYIHISTYVHIFSTFFKNTILISYLIVAGQPIALATTLIPWVLQSSMCGPCATGTPRSSMGAVVITGKKRQETRGIPWKNYVKTMETPMVSG